MSTASRKRKSDDPGPASDFAGLLSRLAKELTETHDPGLAVRSVLQNGAAIVGMTHGAAVLLDESLRLVQAVAHNLEQERAEALGEWLVTEGRREVAGALSSIGWPRLKDMRGSGPGALAEAGFSSALLVPLAAHGRLHGLLVFLSESERDFSPEAVARAEAVAHCGALAVDNALLFDAALRQAVELGTFYETVTATAEGRQTGPLMERMIQQAARLLECRGGVICRLDRDREVLHVVSGIRDEDLGDAAKGIPLGKGAAGIAAASRQIIRIDDYAAWPHRLESVPMPASATVRVLAVPLEWQREVLGVLLLWADGSRQPFCDSDAQHARLVAHQAASALGVAQLLEAEREQRRMAEALQQASIAINRMATLDEVLGAILEQVSWAIPCDAANFQVYEHRQARVVRGRGYERFGVTEAELCKQTFSVDRHPNFRRMVAGEAVVVSDTLGDSSWVDLPGFEWIRSWAGAPLRVGEEILGFLCLDSAVPNTFGAVTGERLMAFAAHASIAMHNARLYEKLANEHVKLLQVYEIGQRVSSSLQAEEILANLLEGIISAASATFAAVFAVRLDEKGFASPVRILTMGTASEVEGDLPPPESLAEEVAIHQAPRQVLVGNAQREHWVLGVPVFVGDRLWGVTLTYVPRRQGEEPPGLGMMAAAVQQAGLALLNAEQHARVQRRLAEMTLIQEMAAAVAGRLETESVLTTLTESLHKRLGYPSVQVLMRHGEDMVMSARAGPRPLLDRIAMGRGIVGRVMRTGRPEFVSDVRKDPDYVAGLVGTRSEIAVPIRIQGDVIGVINIESSDPDQLHAEDLDLLQILADQVSVALQNASLYEQVRRNVDELEARVQERTALLEEALEQAKSADRTKAQFVADVSHELRTPLTNIGLYLDLLEMGREDRRGEYMAILRRETERLGSLIEQLLTISEYDADQVELRREMTDLNTLIRVLVGDRARLIGSRQLELVVDTAPDLPRVPVDPQQLMRVMTNLLNNATSYTPSGGRITLETGQRIAEGQKWVWFSVTDTGPGIPEEEKPRVFDRFFRGIAGRASGLPGTGLGLAICKEIVERHGGQIVLATGAGKGTKVTVLLPAGPA